MSVLSAIYTLKNPRCSRPGWQDGSLWYDQVTRKMVLRDQHEQLVHKDTLHPVEAEKLVAGRGVEWTRGSLRIQVAGTLPDTPPRVFTELRRVRILHPSDVGYHPRRPVVAPHASFRSEPYARPPATTILDSSARADLIRPSHQSLPAAGATTIQMSPTSLPSSSSWLRADHPEFPQQQARFI